MADEAHVVLNDSGFRELMTSDDLRDFLMDEAEPVVARAKTNAPKRTGAGAATIRSEPVIDVEFGGEWTVRVSWTRDAYYLYFHDQGTANMPARPFLQDALEGVTQ